MLTSAVDNPALPAGWAAEPKWDGYRAQLAVHTGGRVLLRSRQGTDMTPAFPEIRAAAPAQLPAHTGLDGETGTDMRRCYASASSAPATSAPAWRGAVCPTRWARAA
jgi:ATP-dependent DNA ligase